MTITAMTNINSRKEDTEVENIKKTMITTTWKEKTKTMTTTTTRYGTSQFLNI